MKDITRIEIETELAGARAKFPANRFLFTALAEEFGELAKAYLQKLPATEIRKEAIQVAAMAIRIIEEGDPVYHDLACVCSRPWEALPCPIHGAK